MKKKLKDFTIGEMKAICEKHDDCATCPFVNFEYCSYMWAIGNEHLEEEFEIEGEED